MKITEILYDALDYDCYNYSGSAVIDEEYSIDFDFTIEWDGSIKIESYQVLDADNDPRNSKINTKGLIYIEQHIERYI
tara:strand:+ start:344 stop:577 length:234 start_codon:yes stop_codon:yes gene_type:complete